jgi:tetratricopeptide (TPR) repeat protein
VSTETTGVLENLLKELMQDPEYMQELSATLQLQPRELQYILSEYIEGKRSFAEIYGVKESELALLENSALSYYRVKQYEKARRVYELLLSIAPQRWTARRGIGACYQAEGQWQEAKNALSQALSLEPGDIIANFLMGEIALKLGNNTEALVYFRKVEGAAAKDKLEFQYQKKNKIYMQGLSQPAKKPEVV